MEKLNSVFMENLRYYLELRRKSQIDLARAVDVSSSTVSDWINGRKIPRADKYHFCIKNITLFMAF